METAPWAVNPKRGRVLRLRDTDQDGRADEVTEFIPEVDSPRGLIWDHDRLYLLHPPHMSVFFDQDGDGIAEASQRLISGIAFDFDQRPPDHTTNGLELGVDGWIYIAGGDFGFMDAVGVDGRRLQHRGGGVIRVRPDGTGVGTLCSELRATFWERPPVLCSISSLGTIPMMVVVGISDCITFPGLKIMDTQGFT